MSYVPLSVTQEIEADLRAMRELTQAWFVVDANTGDEVVARRFRSYGAAERAMQRYSRTHRTDEVRVVTDFVWSERARARA